MPLTAEQYDALTRLELNEFRKVCNELTDTKTRKVVQM